MRKVPTCAKEKKGVLGAKRATQRRVPIGTDACIVTFFRNYQAMIENDGLIDSEGYVCISSANDMISISFNSTKMFKEINKQKNSGYVCVTTVNRSLKIKTLLYRTDTMKLTDNRHNDEECKITQLFILSNE